MSANESQLAKNRKIATIATVFALVAFLGVAGFATVSVTSNTSLIEGAILDNKDGVPESWDRLDSIDTIQASTEAQVSNNYVEYTTAVKNSNDTSATLTHIASYLEEEGNKGFVPLTEKTLEYSYNPEKDNSWTPVQISVPSNDANGYKLDSALYLGEEGSNTDTVYFRYSVSPAEEGTISDKVAFVTEDADGNAAVSVSDTFLEYQKPAASEESDTTETTTIDSDDEDDSYAKPLGVSSKAPNTTVVNASSIGAISISQETVAPSIITVFIALGIFVTSLIVYLAVRNKSTKKSRR